MQRGEVWWGDLPPPAGRSPVLLLSHDAAYSVRTSVTVAVITRTIRPIPVEVVIGREDGLPEKFVVNLDEIITIPMRMISGHVATLSGRKMEAVARAISFGLDLKLH